MLIEKGSLVTILYSFKSSEGVLLGSSDLSGPFTFVLGRGDAISGLENNLLGFSVGAFLEFKVLACDAYGEVNEELIRVLPRVIIDSKGDMEKGQKIEDPTGKILPKGIIFNVKEVNSQTVVLDANHPMAGKDLTFSVQILYVGDYEEAEDFHNDKKFSCCSESQCQNGCSH